jgi:hypothetical protein
MISIHIDICQDVDDMQSMREMLEQYTDTVLLAHEGLPTHYEMTDDGVKISCERDMARRIIDRLLEDYVSMGYEMEIPLDLYALIVYCSDAKLQALFVCERMNIERAINDASAHCSAEDANLVKGLQEQVAAFDVLHTYNGTYKMRKIIQTFAKALEQKGIFVEDELQECFVEQTH